MIRLFGLTRAFDGRTAVDDVSLEVGKGEVFALLGPNGAGKTTTVRMLATLIAPTRGSATVGGFDITDPTTALALRAQVGLLPEQPGLYERLTCFQNLDYHARLYGVPSARRAANIENLLRTLDLWQRRDDAVATFSKGMRQKVAIARALAHDPAVVFLDEPTASLDPEASRTVRESIEALKAEGRTVWINTHNLAEAERLATRIGILQGRLVAVGTPDELRARGGPRACRVELAGPAAPFVQVAQQAGFAGARAQERALLVVAGDARQDTPRLVRALVEAGAGVVSVSDERPSLEAVYLEALGVKA